MRILVEGLHRGAIVETIPATGYLCAAVKELPDSAYGRTLPKTEAMVREALSIFSQFVDLSPRAVQDTLSEVFGMTDPSYVADFIAHHATFHYLEKQRALEELHQVKRLA